MKRKNERWETFKRVCEEFNTGFDSRILDYIAVYDILKYHISGLSLESIKTILKEDEWYIIRVIKDFLDMEPFDEDLDFNPLLFYHLYVIACQGNMKNYINRVYEETNQKYTKGFLRKCFRASRKFKQIHWKVEDYYAKG
jgi:hypothetical protein